ncbi:MAG: hypothetical protein AMXMBFR72_11420 [Betaproteobacteria bacterium]|jgi:hypothetical protein
MSCRYAVYFAPDPASPWWARGCAWLGRDALGGAAVVQPRIEGVDAASFARITAAPRRYGWHATLKPPFRLAAGADERMLRARLAALAARLRAVALGRLEADSLGRFVALVAPKDAALEALAARCVVELDDLRAPPGEDELTRRAAAVRDARERELLASYGYRYVLDRFRLHFSLTGALDHSDTPHAASVLAAARRRFDPLNEAAPLRLDRLSLFVEPGPGAPLARVADFPLSGAA